MCAAAVEHNRVAHRLGDEWIMEYAAGTLSEGEAILVASHLSFLPDAAETLEVAEAIGGSLLEHETSASMAPDALASVLARIDGAATAAPIVRTNPAIPGRVSVMLSAAMIPSSISTLMTSAAVAYMPKRP